MRTVPRWSLLSSAAAPVLLVGGWRLAAARQPGGFDPVTQTISALAARGTPDRGIMTTSLAGVGACHLLTALGLRTAAAPGRALLATGGAATVAVAMLPQSPAGESAAHVAAAGVAFPAMSLWPVLAWQQGGRPGRAASLGAASVLLGLLGWFGAEYRWRRTQVGRSERLLAGTQALWPLAAVLLARRAAPGGDRR